MCLTALLTALTLAGCTNDDDDDDNDASSNNGSSSAYSVGDIVLSDGTIISAANANAMSTEQKAAAVAVIFYVGSRDDILGARTLGVGLQNTYGEAVTGLAWCIKTADGYKKSISALLCTPSDGRSYSSDTTTFTGTINGSNSWTTLCDAVNDEDTKGNYPAWEWVNAYAASQNLTGDFASGWYIPSCAELTVLYRAKETVNTSLIAANGTALTNNYYLSSSQSNSSSSDGFNYAWRLSFESGSIWDKEKRKDDVGVCCIRSFN